MPSNLIQFAADAMKAGDVHKAYLFLLLAQANEPDNPVLPRAVETLAKQVPQLPTPRDGSEEGGSRWTYQQLSAAMSELAKGQASLQGRLDAVVGELNRLALLIADLTKKGVEFKASPVPAADAIPIPAEPGDSGHPVIEWLKDRGIQVKSHKADVEDSPALIWIANFLGSRFQMLEPLYEKMKRGLATGSAFTYNLRDANQETIATLTQFCTQLQKYAFLQNYNYDRNGRVIRGRFDRDGAVINFMNGGWFELYAALSVMDQLKQAGLPYAYLSNAQIELQNNDTFELDLLFLVNGSPLWLECKTGDYTNYIKRYVEMRGRLGVDVSRAMLILTRLDDRLAVELNSLYALTFLSIHTFENHVHGLIKNNQEPIPQVEPQSDQQHDGIVPASRLVTMLNNKDLRPSPELRPRFFNKLVDHFNQKNGAVTLPELKASIAEDLGTSKSKIQDLMNALFNGEAFIGANGKPIISILEPVHGLATMDVRELEKTCIQMYLQSFMAEGIRVSLGEQVLEIRKALLMQDPT